MFTYLLIPVPFTHVHCYKRIEVLPDGIQSNTLPFILHCDMGGEVLCSNTLPFILHRDMGGEVLCSNTLPFILHRDMGGEVLCSNTLPFEVMLNVLRCRLTY